MTTLTLLHLYPRELGINGDVGNVTALVERARWQGIAVEVLEHGIGDELPGSIDLVHIGSGPLSSQRVVHADLLRIAAGLRRFAEDGVPFLAIAGGWQLLGHEIVTPEGDVLEGAAVFPSRATLSTERTVGEIVIRTGSAVLAGFENHSAVTRLDDGTAPFGTVLSGGGNTPSAAEGERAEGIRTGSSIGTHLHGPLLPMNPAIADELLRTACERRGEPFGVAETQDQRLVDEYAANARAAILGRLNVRV